MRKLVIGIAILSILNLVSCGNDEKLSMNSEKTIEKNIEEILSHPHFENEHKSCEVLLDCWQQITNVHNEVLKEYENDKNTVDYKSAIDKFSIEIEKLDYELKNGNVVKDLKEMYSAFISNIEGFQESYKLMDNEEIKRGQKLGKKIIKNFQNNSDIFDRFHKNLK